MKKVLISLAIVLGLFIGTPVYASKTTEKVPVYMFSKDGCSACISAEAYFEELEETYPDLFELREIVAFASDWSAVSSDRSNLISKVYDYFGEDSSSIATPSIVIGDYFTKGLPNDTDKVYNAIVDAQKNSAEDIVKGFIDDLGLNLEELLKYDKESTQTVTKEKSNDALIIGVVFGVVLIGFVGLVIISRKD